jgi:hypothetical protein
VDIIGLIKINVVIIIATLVLYQTIKVVTFLKRFRKFLNLAGIPKEKVGKTFQEIIVLMARMASDGKNEKDEIDAGVSLLARKTNKSYDELEKICSECFPRKKRTLFGIYESEI